MKTEAQKPQDRAVAAQLAEYRECLHATFLADPKGRKALGWFVFDHCGLNRKTHRPGAPGYERDSQEGRRECAIELLEELESISPQSRSLVQRALAEYHAGRIEP